MKILKRWSFVWEYSFYIYKIFFFIKRLKKGVYVIYGLNIYELCVSIIIMYFRCRQRSWPRYKDKELLNSKVLYLNNREHANVSCTNISCCLTTLFNKW